MKYGLKLANHTTMIAVNPCPPNVSVFTTWFKPFVSIKPTKPQIAPDTTKVLITTFLTFIPTYLAVFTDSPTNDNSKPCFVFLMYIAIAATNKPVIIIKVKYS